MPINTAQLIVIGHRIAAMILKESFFFAKKLPVKMTVDNNILKPKPARQPKNKKVRNLLLLMSGSMLPSRP